MFTVPVVQQVVAAARRPGLNPGSSAGGFVPKAADVRRIGAGRRAP
jgi:hypothetical protein